MALVILYLQEKTDWVVTKTLHVITFAFLRFFKIKNVTFYGFLLCCLLYMFFQTMSLMVYVH